MGRAVLGTLAVSGALAVLGACTPAWSMPSASARLGVRAGGEVGASISNGTHVAGSGDIGIGIPTSFLGRTTEIQADVLSVGLTQNLAPFGNINVRANLVTLGLMQPFTSMPGVSIAGEAGLSYLSASGTALGISQSASKTSGFVGVRASGPTVGSLQVNGMARYHFLQDGLYQLGVGATMPGSGGLSYQVDYYHTGGTSFSGFSSSSDSILVGLRWSGGL